MRLRIPGLVDLIRVENPETVLALAREPRLDRDFDKSAPLLNRLLLKRIRRAFSHAGRPLPAVLPRDDPERQRQQTALEARLADLAPAPEDVAALAGFVRGVLPDVGQAAQEAVGRTFFPDYRASQQSWQAARRMDTAPRTLNPFRLLVWAVTHAILQAQRDLARPVKGDPAAIHATGIAVHSLVRSLEAMRDLWADPAVRAGSSPQCAAFRSLRAPQSVPRRSGGAAMVPAGDLREGTMVLLQLDAARERDPRPETVFLTGTWSQCPAHAWVPRLLEAVWARAIEEDRDGS